MLKKLIIGVVVLVAIIGGASYFALSNLDSMIKATIEKYGSQVTQTTVTVNGVNTKLSTGEASLTGIVIGNPQDFISSKAFDMGEISAKLDIASLSSDGPIILNEIVIDKPSINFEVNTQGKNNLQTLEKNIKSYTKTPAATEPANEAKTSDGAPQRKLVINNLYIRDGAISISQALIPEKPLSAKLPTIHLTNIGKDKGGATPAQVAERVLGAITADAAKVASNSISEQLSEELKSAAGKKVQEIEGKLKGLLGE
jgi:uncharacterized protein involved in outer membrane biogenesis